MGIIYKITNNINNKIYIGQTRLPEPRRWQQHVWHANNNPSTDCLLLCQAIQKYGKDNFTREIIEEVDEEQLNEREQYWIRVYNSTDKAIGYNLSLGGEGHSKFEDKEIVAAFEKYGSVIEVSRYLNLSREQVSRRLQGMGYITTREIPIKQYTPDGKLVAIYPTVAEASKQTGISASGISSTNALTAGGYIWLRDKPDNSIEQYLEKLRLENKNLPGIEQYDFNGELVGEFKTAAEAARALNINVSSIKAALLGKQKTAGGFLWRKKFNGLTYEEMYNNFLLSPSCCGVEEIDKDNNTIHQFSSSNEAEAYYGWGGNMVKPVCDGKKKSVNGKYFRYSNSRKRELLGIK